MSLNDLLADCQIQLSRITKTGPSTRLSKKILLTGATGYLGAYLLKELISQTTPVTADITCLVRSSNAKTTISDKIGSSEFSVVVGDVSLPKFGLTQEGTLFINN